MRGHRFEWPLPATTRLIPLPTMRRGISSCLSRKPAAHTHGKWQADPDRVQEAADHEVAFPWGTGCIQLRLSGDPRSGLFVAGAAFQVQGDTRNAVIVGQRLRQLSHECIRVWPSQTRCTARAERVVDSGRMCRSRAGFARLPKVPASRRSQRGQSRTVRRQGPGAALRGTIRPQ